MPPWALQASQSITPARALGGWRKHVGVSSLVLQRYRYDPNTHKEMPARSLLETGRLRLALCTAPAIGFYLSTNGFGLSHHSHQFHVGQLFRLATSRRKQTSQPGPPHT